MDELTRTAIASVDWEAYELMGGRSASHFGDVLSDLLSSADADESTRAWMQIEEYVFSQGNISSAAEPTVVVLLASMTSEQPPWRTGRILDLLYFIILGGSLSDDDLERRCRERAREGVWLLIKWAQEHDDWSRQGAIEVLEIIAPQHLHLFGLTPAVD